MDRTTDGRAFRMLTIVDEFTRECLAIDVSRKLTSEDVLERLSDLFVRRGVPDHIRSDNGSEFTAKRVREWLERVGVKTLYIEPGSPWENGYAESFNGKLRDELLAREVFDTLLEAKVLIERWRRAYNIVRPHSSLGYRPPGPGGRPPVSARFGYASASGQGRAIGRATLVIETGCNSGVRSDGSNGERQQACSGASTFFNPTGHKSARISLVSAECV
jgi:transposase InsO family protein